MDIHSNERLAQRRLELFNVGFDTVHRCGIGHQAAKTLLRLDTIDREESLAKNNYPFFTIEYVDNRLQRTASLNTRVGRDSYQIPVCSVT